MRFLIAGLMILFSLAVTASDETGGIYEMTTAQSMETFYPKLYKSLESTGFYVIFEANIGKNLAHHAEKWGADYNRNQFEAVKSMVICNPYYANQVLNLDPRLMALCPLTVTVLYKQGTSTVLFERLTPFAVGSRAEDIIWEVENLIISAIEEVM